MTRIVGGHGKEEKERGRREEGRRIRREEGGREKGEGREVGRDGGREDESLLLLNKHVAIQSKEV